MACVCVGGGGGCSVAQTTVQEYLTAFGVAYNPSDPMPYAISLAAKTPAGIGSFLNFYKQLGEACLRSRALLFCNKTPGDCGQYQNPGGINPLQLSGQLGSTGIGVAEQLGTSAATEAGAAGLVSAIPIVGAVAGVALTAVLEIFQSHAAAEQRQANLLCTIVPQYNKLLQQVDAAVFSGQASPQQGFSTLQQAAQSFRTNTAQFTKPCNAFCAYDAICDAMADISQYYYGMLATPGNASALQVGSATYDEIPQPSNGIPGSQYIPPTYATSGNTLIPVVSPFASNPSAILGHNISPLAIAAAIILGIMIFRKG